MGGKASRTKGHNFERKVANALKPIWPGAVRGTQTRGGTSQEPDVDGTPYYIECKKGKRTNIKAALKQALDGSDGRPPVAISQDDRKPIIVSMYFDDWYALVAQLEEQ